MVGRVGREANKLLEGHKAVVTCAAWSKDGKTILTGDAEGIVITWDAETFKEKSRLKLGGRVAAVAFTADGKHSAAAAASPIPLPNQGGIYTEEIFVWEAANPAEKSEADLPPRRRRAIRGSGVAGVRSGRQGVWRWRSPTSRICARLGELVGKVRVFA